MFFLPQVLKGSFNNYYILTNTTPVGENIQPVNLWSGATSFVRQFDVPFGYWRRLLHSHSDIDLRHAQKSEEELVAHLLESGRLRAYQVPGPEEVSRLASVAVTDKNSGIRYVFLPGNASLVMHASHRRAINSVEEAEAFLNAAALSDQQIQTLVAFLSEQQAPTRLNPHQRLVHALVNGSLGIGIAPSSSPAKPKGAESEEVASTARPVSLGPHAEAGYVPPAPQATPAPAPAEQTNQPAQSLEECEQRLAAARERLEVHGYQPKYTDEELLKLAEKGELDDRFIVRFTESKYAGDTDFLGKKVDGNVKFWSTTFNQLENADTDPKTICSVLGIKNYDPEKSYSLVVVDTQTADAGQSLSFVPTHEKLGEFAINEVKRLDPERVKEVMTPEYNQVYAEHMAQFNARNLDIENDGDIRGYADRSFTFDKDKQQFKTRAKIHQRLGANECFRGDGTTENLLPGKQRCGVMETFTYDKNPQTLSSLEKSNSAKRIAAKPLRKTS